METQTMIKDTETRDCIVLSCSGACELGPLADNVARNLNHSDSFKMNCLAKVAARDKALLEELQENDTLVIDGCEVECAKKIMEDAWLTNYQYLKLTDLEFTKKTDVDDKQLISRIYDHINHSSDLKIVEHTRPVVSKSCNEDTCDMFDFLSDYVGLKILHPGGRQSTQQFFASIKPRSDMKILDIACGKGRTAVHLAKKYGCKVIGIDILEKSVEEAKRYAQKNKVDHLVSFRVADAQNLPFESNEFDMTISQAMLILVDDKVKVVEEAARVLKPGGTSAWLELSWKKDPTKEFLRDATEGICAKCISNVISFEKWREILQVDEIGKVDLNAYNMTYRGLLGMIRDEGLLNGLKVMYRFMLYPKIRSRMMRLENFFKSYPEYIGYGIYIGTK